MKAYTFRLRRGSDLLLGLQEFAEKQNITAAVILSCVGCLSQARLRDASGITIKTLCCPTEIVSATGTVSKQRTHLHISLSQENMQTIGGHLVEGCIVNTTAEICLLAMSDRIFDEEFDEQTGYGELIIKNL